MSEEKPYTNRDLAIDYGKLVTSVFPGKDIKDDEKIVQAISNLEIDLPATYKQYRTIPKLIRYGIGPIARRALLNILQYGVENRVRGAQEELVKLYSQMQIDLKHPQQAQKSGTDTLVDKCIVDSNISGEPANNIKQNLVSGINPMYQEIMGRLPKRYNVDYALPVKIIGADDNSYVTQWAIRFRSEDGVIVNSTYFVHDVSTNKVSQHDKFADETSSQEGIISLVPEHLRPRDSKIYSIDELIGVMKKADYNTGAVREFKKMVPWEQFEDNLYWDQSYINLFLNKEQVRKITKFCTSNISQFKEVNPSKYQRDVLFSQALFFAGFMENLVKAMIRR